MILTQGKLTIKTIDDEYTINVGEIIILNRQIFHKLCSYDDNTVVLEFEMINPNKNDLIRLHDKYNREKKQYESKQNIISDAYLHENYFEYYSDTLDNVIKNFNDSHIEFKKGKFDNTIKNNSIIVIFEGQLNINGIYIGPCSILKGYDIINKNISYITDEIRYMHYDINTK